MSAAHIALVAVGSRGDVQPMVALGLGLRRAGHSVTLAALDGSAALVEAHGLRFASLGTVPTRFTKPGRRRVPPFHGVVGRALFWSVYRGILAERLPSFVRACEGADAIVFTGLAYPAADIAERQNIPGVWASPVPHTATEAFPDPFFASWGVLARLAVQPRDASSRLAGLRSRIVRGSYGVEKGIRELATGGVLDAWRRAELGMSSRTRRCGPRVSATLYSCSPTLVPRPPDWPSTVHMTGHWPLPSPVGWSAPPPLREFVAEGPPPVCVGFGAMTARAPRRLYRIAVEALERSGRRGVLVGFPGERGRRSANLFTVDETSHSWLLPGCVAMVHHGGVGTALAAARAGVPSICVPFSYDQFFWSARLEALGVSPPAIPSNRLSAAGLADVLAQVGEDSRWFRRARSVAEPIRNEVGIRRAVEVIEALL